MESKIGVLAEKVGRLADMTVMMNAILQSAIKHQVTEVRLANGARARLSVDHAEAMLSCNACDVIDPFTQENELGYCRNCFRQVAPEEMAAMADAKKAETEENGKNRITLFRTKEGWMAKQTDPAVKELFGTDTIITAFTAQAAKSVVLKEMKAWNPDAIVEAEGPENAWDDVTLFPRK